MPITQSDIEHASRKWCGRDDERGIRWQANDAEFYRALSDPNARIDARLVRRFSAANNDEKRPTGGYSIIRAMWGGADVWAENISRFRDTHVVPARDQFGEESLKRKAQVAISLHLELGGILGISRNGRSRPLGISAASKFLFFMCPEFPFFIYDDVARLGMGFNQRLGLDSYAEWVKRCAERLSPDHLLLVRGHLPPNYDGRVDWFTRRCLDLALYRLGLRNNQ